MKQEWLLHQTDRPHSSYFKEVQRQLAELQGGQWSPPSIEEAQKCITYIDKLFVENLRQFKVPGTGTIYPITHVPVTDVIRGMYHPPEEHNPDSPGEAHIFFPGYYHSPTLHPFGHGDFIYNEVTGHMPKVARSFRSGTPIESQVYVWGYPTGVWGKVDEKWIISLQKNGLSQYANDIADFVRSINGHNTSFVFHGMSAGSAIAALTAKELRTEFSTTSKAGKTRPKLQVLLDNPAGIHEGLVKGVQVPLGFVLEAIVRGIADPASRRASLAIGPNAKELIPYLSQKDIDPFIGPEEQRYKIKAILTGLIGLIKGTTLDTEEMHTFIRQGIADPVSFSVHNVGREALKYIARKLHHADRTKDVAFELLPSGDEMVVHSALRTSHAIGYVRPQRIVYSVCRTKKILGEHDGEKLASNEKSTQRLPIEPTMM